MKLTIRRAVPDDASAYAVILGDESVFPGTLQLPYPTEAGWRERLTAKTNEGDIHLVWHSPNLVDTFFEAQNYLSAFSLKLPPRFLHKYFFHDPGRFPGT